MKKFARFFQKKSVNVSDFKFQLKKTITFHVLAEFFLEKINAKKVTMKNFQNE
jgi:hypothetical protein